jgi:hypothetical protein
MIPPKPHWPFHFNITLIIRTSGEKCLHFQAKNGSFNYRGAFDTEVLTLLAVLKKSKKLRSIIIDKS